jgi:hypothetical protein
MFAIWWPPRTSGFEGVAAAQRLVEDGLHHYLNLRVADSGLVTFSCAAKRRVTKEKAAPVSRHFVVALCYSTSRAAVELALVMSEHAQRARVQTVLAEFPGPPVLLGGSQGVH